MDASAKPRTILMADDDIDDRMLVRDAIEEIRVDHDLRCVGDGEELFEYLKREGRYAAGREAPRPQLILLDLKMPKKDGREVLRQLKADPELRHIPVVVLTTSTAEEDIAFAYEMGVNSYITKPPTFRELISMMRAVSQYWFGCVQLPPA